MSESDYSERDGLVPDTKDKWAASYGSTTGHANSGGSHGSAGGKCMVGDPKGSVLSCHSISYEVMVKTKACCGRPEPKRILRDIDGIFKPGMNAILGPTGSGKSSLLDVLAGRKDPGGLKGDLLIDGGPLPDNFKCMVGYVVQDDVVMGTLTVRENFHFSAALRLPSKVSKAEREARVDQVIFELGLGSCADTKVGNEFIRGVSGGERKRCNIGMELIIQPPVLFLDEPTTGLDASTANAVMLLLQRLACKGRTVVFSIHQPRYTIYRTFDTVILLSGGETVYFGSSSEALDYFETIGYICEPHNNPPDFFLDIINGDSTAITATKPHNSEEPAVAVEIEGDTSTLGQTLAKSYRESRWYSRLHAELTPIKEQYDQQVKDGTVVVKAKVKYATSFVTQLHLVSLRTIKNLVRNPQASIMQFIIMAIFAVIVGAVYYKLDTSMNTGIQNRAGAFFFIVMNQVFGNLSAVELFIKERAIFIHENVSGFYRVSAYFAAKIICDVIPMRFIPVTIFCVIAYFMIGLRSGVEHFFFFLLNLFMTTLAASSFAFFISASVKIFAVANLLIALCYVFMMLFSGLLVNFSSIGDWLSWIRYLSIFRYSLNALYINELMDQPFCNSNGTQAQSTCGSNVTEIQCTDGNQYLQMQSIPFGTAWDLWVNELALGLISIGFFILGYIQLRRLKKLR